MGEEAEDLLERLTTNPADKENYGKENYFLIFLKEKLMLCTSQETFFLGEGWTLGLVNFKPWEDRRKQIKKKYVAYNDENWLDDNLDSQEGDEFALIGMEEKVNWMRRENKTRKTEKEISSLTRMRTWWLMINGVEKEVKSMADARQKGLDGMSVYFTGNCI